MTTRSSSTTSPRSLGFWVLLGLLAVIDALVIAAIPAMLAVDQLGLAAFAIVATLALNVVYLLPRARASKWILPGFLFMAIFVIWPVIYTAFVSFTNWATGNILTREQVVTQLERVPIPGETGPVTLPLHVFRDADGALRFWIPDTDGDVYFGEPRDRSAEPLEDALDDPEELGVVDEDGDGIPESVGPFERLMLRDLFAIAGDLERLVLDLPTGIAQVQTVSQVSVVASTQRFVYDDDTGVMFDALQGVACTEETGNFVCGDQVISPGWRVVIGFDNYVNALTRPSLRGPLIQIFAWNMVFATGSVALTFGLGLGLALAVQPERIRGKAIYRSIYIIPYAIPAFISAVVWRGLLNTRFGQVNDLIGYLGIDPIPWLEHPTWAKVAVLLVNMWLGFPYMFLITTGALQSIPVELKEAATVDGAGPRRVFRAITLPLLLVSTAPLLIGSFAFNFNNFVLIFILTRGGPPVVGAAVPYGSTDILINFVFNLAFSSGRGSNFGLASAFTILIFVLVALFSIIGFRMSRNLEEVYGDA